MNCLINEKMLEDNLILVNKKGGLKEGRLLRKFYPKLRHDNF
jgi:hypothetical protein